MFKKLRESFERILEGRPQVVDAILSAEDPLADSVVRCAVEEGRMAILRVAGGCSSDLLPTHECSPVRGRLLQLLVSYSGDWDSDVPRWYTDGCPVGLEVPIPVKGVFPTEASGLEPDSECSLSFIDGSSDLSGYSNYESVEDNPDAVISLLREKESKGFCTFYESLSDVQKAVDGDPLVLTKVAIVPKAGTVPKKYRLICDARRNNLNRHVVVREHLVLPRVIDAVTDVCHLMSASHGDHVDAMVIDFESAFRTLPLDRRELHYHVVKVKKYYVLFRCLIFGLKSSPVLWGRAAAQATRLAQLLYDSRDPDCGRIETFVDDPFIAVKAATVGLCRLLLCIPALLWLCLGYRLSFPKRQVGFPLKWIGITIWTVGEGVVVSLSAQKLATICGVVESVVDRRLRLRQTELRRLCGRLSWVGHVVPYFNAFTAGLWRRLSLAEKLQQAWVPAKDLYDDLRWVKAFFAVVTSPSSEGALPVNRDYLRLFPTKPASDVKKDIWVIQVDGSPVGVGGILIRNEIVVRWFADELTNDDLSVFSAARGDCRWQSVWEGLALLLGVRLWRALIPTHSVVICRSDSAVVLSSAMSFRSKSASLNCIMRELALDCALGARWFDFHFEHIKGSQNTSADCLSRLSAGKAVPPSLAQIPRDSCPRRDASFWRVTGTESPSLSVESPAGTLE